MPYTAGYFQRVSDDLCALIMNGHGDVAAKLLDIYSEVIGDLNDPGALDRYLDPEHSLSDHARSLLSDLEEARQDAR